MSQASMSQKLDAARKRTREAEQKLADAHPALRLIPASFLSLLVMLETEATNPTRITDELGIHVNGGERWDGHRSNRAAAAAIERLQKLMYDQVDIYLGKDDGKQAGRIEQIIYGKNASNTAYAPDLSIRQAS